MNDQALMTRNDAGLTVAFAPEAHALKREALGQAALVVVVETEFQQTMAVEAAKSVHRILLAIEKNRKELKAPVIDFGKNIDKAAKDFVAELQAEETRLNTLVGDYQTILQARARAEEALRLQELTEAEQRKQQTIAEAQSHEEIDRANEEFSQTVASLAPAPVIPRAEGQTVRSRYEWEFTDKQLFVKCHWNLVRDISVDKIAIQELLQAGHTLQGIKAVKKFNSSVRATTDKPVDV